VACAFGYAKVEYGKVAQGDEQMKLQILASFPLLFDCQPRFVPVDAEACAIRGEPPF
jgi:hypothetical protein